MSQKIFLMFIAVILLIAGCTQAPNPEEQILKLVGETEEGKLIDELNARLAEAPECQVQDYLEKAQLLKGDIAQFEGTQLVLAEDVENAQANIERAQACQVTLKKEIEYNEDIGTFRLTVYPEVSTQCFEETFGGPTGIAVLAGNTSNLGKNTVNVRINQANTPTGIQVNPQSASITPSSIQVPEKSETKNVIAPAEKFVFVFTGNYKRNEVKTQEPFSETEKQSVKELKQIMKTCDKCTAPLLLDLTKNNELKIKGRIKGITDYVVNPYVVNVNTCIGTDFGVNLQRSTGDQVVLIGKCLEPFNFSPTQVTLGEHSGNIFSDRQGYACTQEEPFYQAIRENCADQNKTCVSGKCEEPQCTLKMGGIEYKGITTARNGVQWAEKQRFRSQCIGDTDGDGKDDLQKWSCGIYQALQFPRVPDPFSYFSSISGGYLIEDFTGNGAPEDAPAYVIHDEQEMPVTGVQECGCAKVEGLLGILPDVELCGCQTWNGVDFCPENPPSDRDNDGRPDDEVGDSGDNGGNPGGLPDEYPDDGTGDGGTNGGNNGSGTGTGNTCGLTEEGDYVTMCEDTDGGGAEDRAGRVRGTVFIRDEENRVCSRESDRCLDGTHLREWYCIQGVTRGERNITCNEFCNEGVCYDEPRCTDTDAGTDPDHMGTVTITDESGNTVETHADECVDSTHVREWYCADQLEAVSQNFTCKGCVNGQGEDCQFG